MQINIFNMMYMENECPKDTKVDQMKKKPKLANSLNHDKIDTKHATKHESGLYPNATRF